MKWPTSTDGPALFSCSHDQRAPVGMSRAVLHPPPVHPGRNKSDTMGGEGKMERQLAVPRAAYIYEMNIPTFRRRISLRPLPYLLHAAPRCNASQASRNSRNHPHLPPRAAPDDFRTSPLAVHTFCNKRPPWLCHLGLHFHCSREAIAEGTLG